VRGQACHVDDLSLVQLTRFAAFAEKALDHLPVARVGRTTFGRAMREVKTGLALGDVDRRWSAIRKSLSRTRSGMGTGFSDKLRGKSE